MYRSLRRRAATAALVVAGGLLLRLGRRLVAGLVVGGAAVGGGAAAGGGGGAGSVGGSGAVVIRAVCSSSLRLFRRGVGCVALLLSATAVCSGAAPARCALWLRWRSSRFPAGVSGSGAGVLFLVLLLLAHEGLLALLRRHFFVFLPATLQEATARSISALLFDALLPPHATLLAGPLVDQHFFPSPVRDEVRVLQVVVRWYRPLPEGAEGELHLRKVWDARVGHAHRARAAASGGRGGGVGVASILSLGRAGGVVVVAPALVGGGVALLLDGGECFGHRQGQLPQQNKRYGRHDAHRSIQGEK